MCPAVNPVGLLGVPVSAVQAPVRRVLKDESHTLWYTFILNQIISNSTLQKGLDSILRFNGSKGICNFEGPPLGHPILDILHVYTLSQYFQNTLFLFVENPPSYFHMMC